MTNSSVGAKISCPEGYYFSDATSSSGRAECIACPNQVSCSAGSFISDRKLAAGTRRASSKSDDIHKCRFGETSCPGNIPNQATGDDPYCAFGFVGPLCAASGEEFSMPWSGGGVCNKCAAGKAIGQRSALPLASSSLSWHPSRLRGRQRERKSPIQAPLTFPTTLRPRVFFFAEAETVFLLAKIKLFTLFLAAQARWFRVNLPLSQSHGHLCLFFKGDFTTRQYLIGNG